MRCSGLWALVGRGRDESKRYEWQGGGQEACDLRNDQAEDFGVSSPRLTHLSLVLGVFLLRDEQKKHWRSTLKSLINCMEAASEVKRDFPLRVLQKARKVTSVLCHSCAIEPKRGKLSSVRPAAST